MIIDAMIVAAEPAEDEWSFEFANLELKFRTVADYSDLISLKRRATDYAEEIVDADPRTLGAIQRELQPRDKEAAYWAYMLAETCLEPNSNLTAFLKMAKRAGALFGAIVHEWQSRQSRACRPDAAVGDKGVQGAD